MATSYLLSHPTAELNCEIPLESSKSESNRALIIQALGGKGIVLDNLSQARDTQTMIRLLGSNAETLDVLDAGTTMRFLTAFCTVTNRPTVLTGTARMQQRPIKILVDALRELGAEIEYAKNEGFPPINIKGFAQKQREVAVPGNVSSQYISALLMVAPYLPMGLKLTLTGKVYSRPYINMTLKLMAHFRVRAEVQKQVIDIQPQRYRANQYTIESDWSGASYWYSMAALAKKARIKLLGLRKISFQGDSEMVGIGEKLGVETTFEQDGVVLTKSDRPLFSFAHHFVDCPDLAQTVSVMCAAQSVKSTLTGLESLRIKETDRIEAIKNELGKVGIGVRVKGDEQIDISNEVVIPAQTPVFHTYEDHRMAMAFAPLALRSPIVVEEPEVVQKSYPTFWEHVKLAGFEVKVV